MERVPAGTTFDFVLTIRVFEGDDEASVQSTLAEMWTLLAHDALGGSGSRGSGRVQLDSVEVVPVWPTPHR